MSRFLDIKARAKQRLSSLSPGRSSSRSSNLGAHREGVVDRTRSDPVDFAGEQPCPQNVATAVASGSGGGLEDTAPIVAPVTTRSVDPTASDATRSKVQSGAATTNEPTQCWIAALEELKKNERQAYAQLEGLGLDADHLTRMISKNSQEYEDKARGQASSQWFGRLKRLLPSLGAVKGLSMTVSRADPHQIAPYICASVFCAIELVLNVINPDDMLLILEVVSESTITLQKWLLFEVHARNQNNPASKSQINELFEELPILYGHVLRALLSITSHLNGLRLKKAIDRISQIDVQWKAMFEGVKRSNKKCDAIRAQMEFFLKSQKDSEAVLDWISPRLIGESHNQIMEKTGVSNNYSERGAWLFKSTGFHCWQAGLSGSPTKRALWLKGFPGTGKTTLICRVIETLRLDQSLDRSLDQSLDQSLGSACPAQICHFYCTAGTGSTPPSCETVVRVLLRQLAFLPDFTVSPDASAAYYRHEQALSQKTAMSSEQWKELFEKVISSAKGRGLVVICIDALDECEADQADSLLDLLGALVAKFSHVFLLTTSQLHVKVPIYFADELLTTVETESATSQDDIAYYVDTEMRTRTALRRNKELGILSAEASEELRDRFRAALVTGAKGMFQWVKIWLAIMFPTEPLAHLSEAEDLLKVLEGQSPLDDTVMSSWRSLNDAYLNLYTRVRHRPADRKYKVRAYRIILGAHRPLTLAEVTEAVSVEEDNTLTTSVTEAYVRELCHNFFITNAYRVTAAHESAKLFLQDMLKVTNAERSQLDDYATPTSRAELAGLCARVMMRNDHAIWASKTVDLENCASRFCGQPCGQSLDDLRRSGRRNPAYSLLSLQSVVDTLDWTQLDVLSSRHFVFYVIAFWLDHWQESVFAMNSGTISSDQLPIADFVAMLEDPSGSALSGWMLFIHACGFLRDPHGTAEDPPSIRLGSGDSQARFSKCFGYWGTIGYRILACVERPLDGLLLVNTTLLTMILDIVPYTDEYINFTCSSSTRRPNFDYLWIFLDKIMARLDAKSADGEPLVYISIRIGYGRRMVESALRLERYRCQQVSLNRRPWISKILLTKDFSGNTLLHVAAQSPSIVHTLLNFEADQVGCQFPDTTKKQGVPSGWFSRHACIVNDQLEIPLHLAAGAGNTEVVSLLIDAGAAETLVEDIDGVQSSTLTINAQDVYGLTPLNAAATYSTSSQVIEELLKLPNLEINLAAGGGATALHLLADRDPSVETTRMMSLLLDDGRTHADLANSTGSTPLMLAAYHGNVQVVSMLCRRPDVRPDARNQEGWTALWVAIHRRCANLASNETTTEYDQIIQILLATGKVNPSPLDNDGLSPEARARANLEDEARRRTTECEEEGLEPESDYEGG